MMLFVDKYSEFKVLHMPLSFPMESDFIFCYQDNGVLLTNDNRVPAMANFVNDLSDFSFYCFGSCNEKKCFLCSGDVCTGAQLNFKEFRQGCLSLSREFQNAAALGRHLHYWRNTNCYCSSCGGAMNDKTEECALICTGCDRVIYPKISPCIIVLVTNGSKILLARSPHFSAGVLSTLAGFVSPGETVEQAVVREIREEVGIEVGSIQYVCSQPWPFPDSLMLGFTAKYVAGEICIDKNEIEFAQWFDRDNLPILPDKSSIARYLIDRYLILNR